MDRHVQPRKNHTPTIPAKTLTSIGVGKLKPRLDRYEVRDAGCRGLRVVVQPSGHRSFHLRLWFQNKAYNITLGSVLDAPTTGTTPVIGAPLALADARILAAQCLQRVKSGTHP